MSEPDYVARNRELWTKTNAEYTDGARRAGVVPRRQFTWGVFGVPEADVGVLGDVAGLDVVELGCGTAYFSAWLARQGARPVGVDVTPAQLETARRMQEETGIEFPLVEANAEDVPLPDAIFDLAVSEYGASLWCDPYRWIPEAARLLRPGGRLVFLTEQHARRSSAFPTEPDSTTETLQRPQRGHAPIELGARRTASSSTSATARWIDLLRAPASRSSASSSSTRPTTPRRTRTTTPRPPSGRGSGRAEEMWVARKTRLTLASTSPQRRAILEQLAIPFEVVPPDYVEDDPPDADPIELVRRHAEGKARSVHADGRITLGVDTTVVLDGRVYGKAADGDRRRAHAP